MKKRILTAAIATFAMASLGLFGCAGPAATGSSSSASSDAVSQTSLRVAASPTPHAEILNEAVKPILAEQGIELEVVEFNDYVLPNTSTEEGEVDANYFQHTAYLEQFNQENGTHLVEVVPVHYEPFGLYAGKTKTLADIQDGAKIAVPNDTTNEARALLLLEQAGLIKLDPNAGVTATKQDIVENPHSIDILEVEAASLPRMLEDVDFAAINSNYAIPAGLNVYDDALVFEDPEGTAGKTYANVLVVREGNENAAAIEALAKAMTSDKVLTYLQEKYPDGSVQAVF